MPWANIISFMPKFFRELACELAVAGAVTIPFENRAKNIAMTSADLRLLWAKMCIEQLYQFQLLRPSEYLPVCPGFSLGIQRKRSRFHIEINISRLVNERKINLNSHLKKKSRPISRILSFLRTDHHPSSSAIACRIKRPTR